MYWLEEFKRITPYSEDEHEYYVSLYVTARNFIERDKAAKLCARVLRENGHKEFDPLVYLDVKLEDVSDSTLKTLSDTREILQPLVRKTSSSLAFYWVEVLLLLLGRTFPNKEQQKKVYAAMYRNLIDNDVLKKE